MANLYSKSTNYYLPVGKENSHRLAESNNEKSIREEGSATSAEQFRTVCLQVLEHTSNQ